MVVVVMFVCFVQCLCGVCGIMCDAVWRVVLCCVIGVWLCVFPFMCSWVLFVIYCVVMYGLNCVLCLFVSVPCFKACVGLVDCVMAYVFLFCELFNVSVCFMRLCVLFVVYCVMSYASFYDDVWLCVDCFCLVCL